ncbi:MAG: triose-phosphate isomerase [Nitrospiria bacterium]
MAKPLIIANWKMHKTVADVAAALEMLLGHRAALQEVDLVIAPPTTALDRAGRALAGSPIALAAQNCHWEPAGAYTGEVSVPQVAEVGCTYGLVGHSERRQGCGETNEQVRRKTAALLAAGLTPILCVGESFAERRAGKTEQVVAEQISVALQGLPASQAARLVVAYEPVWAIGTGKTATPAEAATVHRFLRRLIEQDHGPQAAAAPILYGGSVSPDTIEGLLAQAEIGGALVGGASLNISTLLAILQRAALAGRQVPPSQSGSPLPIRSLA